MIQRVFIAVVFTLGLISCSSDEEIMRKDAESKVKSWIIANADFPESYEPVGFDSFHENRHHFVRDTCYGIFHKYKLKDRNGQLTEDRHYFVLIGDKMSLVTKNRTDYIQTIPPSTFIWSNIYGDKLHNVYLSGYDSTNFYNSYRDYCLIGGGIWADFHYLDSDCLLFLKSYLSPKDSSNVDIKRILITASNTVFEERTEKIRTGKMQQSNIQYSDKLAVYTKNDSSEEKCGSLRYHEKENTISLTALDSTENFVFSVEADFLKTKCFKYKLEKFQIRFR